MAKDIIIRIWCDPHMQHLNQKVEATELLPMTLGGTPKTLDMCDECRMQYVEPLRLLLLEMGAAPSVPDKTHPHGRRRASTGPSIQCLWCPKTYSTASSSGYMSHIKIKHGYASANEAFGTVCPVCGQGDVLMMLAHLRRYHPEYGFEHTAQAMIWAKENSDPHGIYEMTMHRAPSLEPQREQWMQQQEETESQDQTPKRRRGKVNTLIAGVA